MSGIERALVLLIFIGVGGFFWAHNRGNKEAE
jgi:hypothetical protein